MCHFLSSQLDHYLFVFHFCVFEKFNRNYCIPSSSGMEFNCELWKYFFSPGRLLLSLLPLVLRVFCLLLLFSGIIRHVIYCCCNHQSKLMFVFLWVSFFFCHFFPEFVLLLRSLLDCQILSCNFFTRQCCFFRVNIYFFDHISDDDDTLCAAFCFRFSSYWNNVIYRLFNKTWDGWGMWNENRKKIVNFTDIFSDSAWIFMCQLMHDVKLSKCRLTYEKKGFNFPPKNILSPHSHSSFNQITSHMTDEFLIFHMKLLEC